MLGYILTFIGGFFVGVILTTILLCKKNLEAYQKISQNAGNAISSNLEVAKAVYNAQLYGETEKADDAEETIESSEMDTDNTDEDE